MEKHVNYFALEKACRQEGCPLCRIVNERIKRYIDGMLFEHISDRTFRALYRSAGGFCYTHSELLLSYRDGLAVAILGRDILEDFMSDFQKKKIRKKKSLCPACAQQEQIEKDFLTFIAETAKTDSKSNPLDFFMQSDGLCVPHYAQLFSFARKIPHWLQDFQENKFTQLLERTSRFIEYSAWGNQAQFEALSQEDKKVWQELARSLRGNKT